MIQQGADPSVVEDMEKELGLDVSDDKDKKPDEHIEEGDEDTKKPKGDEGDLDPNKKPKEGEEDLGNEGKPNPDRPVEHIPAWKVKELQKKAREEGLAEGKSQAQIEFEAKILETGAKPGGATDDDIQKIADEFGLKPEIIPAFIDRIAGAVSSKIKLPDDVARATERIREQDRQAKESEGFEKEWTDPATVAALKAISGGREVTNEVREAIKQLAYTSTYHRYRISDIVRLEGSKLFPPKESKSAEAGRGGVGRGQEVKSIDEMSPEDVLNMPDDEFERLSNELGGKGSKFIKTSKAKK